MDAGEREYAERFFALVLAKRPILELEDRRIGIVDPHHVIPKQRLRLYPPWRRLEYEELWAIVWDPDNGIPVDRGYHELLTTAMRKLKSTELRAENIAFARRHDLFGYLLRELTDAP